MKMNMYAIYDQCSECHDRPFCARTHAEAARSFGAVANDKNHPIGAHPEHFRLYFVGVWDDNLGRVEPVDRTFITSADMMTHMDELVSPDPLINMTADQLINGEDEALLNGENDA